MTDQKRFLINLLSEQTIPNCIAIQETAPSQVLALTTRDFQHQVCQFERLTGVPHTILPVEPYALQETMSTLGGELSRLPADADVVLNFTGGTKVMALASVLAATQPPSRPLTFLYVNTPKARCELYRLRAGKLEPMDAMPFTCSSLQFADVVSLAGEQMKSWISPDDTGMGQRRTITQWLFKHHEAVRNCYAGCFVKVDGKRQPKTKHQFVACDGNARPLVRVEWAQHHLCVSQADGRQQVVEMDKPGKYITGGWFEEHCLREIGQSGLFDEALGGVVLDLSPETQKARTVRGWGPGDKNEIDIVVRSGVRAALIECKTGDWGQDHLYKLHSLAEHLCGTFGSAILVSTKRMAAMRRTRRDLLEKADDMGIHIVDSEDLEKGRLCNIIAACIKVST